MTPLAKRLPRELREVGHDDARRREARAEERAVIRRSAPLHHEQNGLGGERLEPARRIERVLPPGVEAGREVDRIPRPAEVLGEEVERHVSEEGDLHVSTTPRRQVCGIATHAADAASPAPKPARSARPAASPCAASVSATEHEPGFA